MQELLVPLFPLQVVLFPRTNLALHIFEERYKEMIGECIEKRSEFGIVLAQDDGMENVGCTASVSEVVKKYEDGRMDIMVRGQRRFEIMFLDRSKSYLQGAPQFFDEETETVPAGDERRGKAVEIYAEVMRLLEAKADEPLDLQDSQLSYQIMARLPADLNFKQTMLKSRSEHERLSEVITFLQKAAARLDGTASQSLFGRAAEMPVGEG
jgi:Lon protease-like protein